MRAALALCLVVLLLPATASAGSAKNLSAEEVRFRRWLAHHYSSEILEEPDDNLVYGYALIDLDGDGRKEAVVWARGSSICGSGGCDLEVYVRRGSGWRLFSTTGVTRPPIKVLKTRTNGWLDLAATAAGGGIEHPYEVRLRFNGKDYDQDYPADWSGRTPPPLISGRDIISDAAIPLVPARCRAVHEAPSTFGPIPVPSGKPGSC